MSGIHRAYGPDTDALAFEKLPNLVVILVTNISQSEYAVFRISFATIYRGPLNPRLKLGITLLGNCLE